jgi:hypothetical protein
MAKKLLFDIKDLTRLVVAGVVEEYACSGTEVSVRWIVEPGAISCIVLVGGAAEEHEEFHNEPARADTVKTTIPMELKS